MDFRIFLDKLSRLPIKIIAPSVDFSSYTPIDLTDNNKELDEFDIECSASWSKYLQNFLKSRHKSIAFGGYLERRSLYKRSKHFNKAGSLIGRNIHLGIDLWCETDTPVLAVFDGLIHSFSDNTNFGDYGPTIVLKHCIKDVVFYSLYGHLSRLSIKGLIKNAQITQGQVIGKLGSRDINGDYAPHLHFQIIKDIQDYLGDYPGVSSEIDLPFYIENCPDPNLILKL
jgi:murein DD-endopeptidase MepM/ murein hydrolase activator NlpD